MANLPKKLTDGEAYAGFINGTTGIKSGGGSAVAIKTGTVGVDPPSIGAVANGTATVLLSGVVVGDTVILNPGELNDGVFYTGCAVTAAGTVSAYFHNATAGALDAGSADWRYVWIDATL